MPRAHWKPAYHTVDNRNENCACSFNYEDRARWNTWISEAKTKAKTELASWEAKTQIRNSMTGGSGRVRNQPTTNVDQGQQRPVPDSDYYNFDCDRVEEKIKPNEVWALYHDIDTMPRYLIRVKEVSMNGPFWVKAS